MYFSKDVFLIPYYIAKVTDGYLEFLYHTNLGDTDIPNVYRNAKIQKTRIWNETLSLLWSILLRARNANILFIIGSSAKHMLAVWLYKMLNPKGRVVVFGDMEPSQAKEFAMTGFVLSSGFFGYLKRILTEFFFNHVTYIVANTEAYQIMKELCIKKKWKGLLHFYPCLDDELFFKYGFRRTPYSKKENIILYVGRIGNYQKNSEMLLKALENVNLKEWRIFMIGPITSSFDLKEEGSFKEEVDSFFERNPHLRSNLIFTGAIYNSKEIFSYYNRAKVLLMTSRHESWGNVYSEAAALGCYIISTDVGGATLCSNNWQFGTKVEQEDINGLSKVLQAIIDGDIEADESKAIPIENLSYSILTKNVLIPHLISNGQKNCCR